MDSEDEAGHQQNNNGLPSAPQVSPPTYATLHPPMTSQQSSASQSQNEMRREKVSQSSSFSYLNADQDHRTSMHHHFECKCLQPEVLPILLCFILLTRAIWVLYIFDNALFQYSVFKVWKVLGVWIKYLKLLGILQEPFSFAFWTKLKLVWLAC